MDGGVPSHVTNTHTYVCLHSLYWRWQSSLIRHFLMFWGNNFILNCIKSYQASVCGYWGLSFVSNRYTCQRYLLLKPSTVVLYAVWRTSQTNKHFCPLNMNLKPVSHMFFVSLMSNTNVKVMKCYIILLVHSLKKCHGIYEQYCVSC